jgi:hypothetical protein
MDDIVVVVERFVADLRRNKIIISEGDLMGYEKDGRPRYATGDALPDRVWQSFIRGMIETPEYIMDWANEMVVDECTST